MQSFIYLISFPINFEILLKKPIVIFICHMLTRSYLEYCCLLMVKKAFGMVLLLSSVIIHVVMWSVVNLCRVSKGVRDLPGNLQSATSSVPSGKALMYFGLLLASGVFFVFLAFTMFLPVMVIMPQKFAICFTLGCAFIIGSFFALKGPKNQFVHMSSKEVLLPHRPSAFVTFHWTNLMARV